MSSMSTQRMQLLPLVQFRRNNCPCFCIWLGSGGRMAAAFFVSLRHSRRIPFWVLGRLVARLLGFFGFVRCRSVAEKPQKKTGREAQPRKTRKGNQKRKRKRNPTRGDGPASRIKWPARRYSRNPDAAGGGYPDTAAPKRPVHAGREARPEERSHSERCGGGAAPARGKPAPPRGRAITRAATPTGRGSWRPRGAAKWAARETRKGRKSHRSGERMAETSAAGW